MSISTIQNFYKETITRAVTLTGATNIYVSALPTPDEGYVVISPSSSSLREIVYYTAKGTDSNGTYLTVTLANRGLGGTTAQTHAIGEPVRMNVTAEHIKEISDALDEIVAAGAQNASTVTKGITKLSVAPEDSDEPIAVGDNDPRMLGVVPGLVSPYAGSTAPTGWLICDGSAVSRTTYADLYAVIADTYGEGDGSTTFNLPDLRGSVPIGYGQRIETFTFDGASGVDPSTDIITVTSNQWLQTGTAVALTGSSLPTGLSATTYYVIRQSATTIKLASTLANAVAGTAVNITADGSGTCTLTLTLTDRGLGDEGGEENHASKLSEIPAHAHAIQEWSGSEASMANVRRLASMQSVRDINASIGTIIQPEGSQSPSNDIRVANAGGSGNHNNMPPYVVLNYIIKT